MWESEATHIDEAQGALVGSVPVEHRQVGAVHLPELGTDGGEGGVLCYHCNSRGTAVGLSGEVVVVGWGTGSE